MKLRNIFWVGLAIWWGGALIGQLTGNGVIHAISVNIFGLLTTILGVFLLGRWLLRKATGGGMKPEGQADGSVINPRTSKPFGEGMGIYSTFNVPEEARDTIERAIQNDMFKPKGKDDEGRELLYITTPMQDWLAVVEVTDAIMVTAAYKTTAQTVDKDVADYLSA
ncbi:hypothetical protein ACWIDJ_11840 [Brevundimonas naejangsanensis]